MLSQKYFSQHYFSQHYFRQHYVLVLPIECRCDFAELCGLGVDGVGTLQQHVVCAARKLEVVAVVLKEVSCFWPPQLLLHHADCLGLAKYHSGDWFVGRVHDARLGRSPVTDIATRKATGPDILVITTKALIHEARGPTF